MIGFVGAAVDYSRANRVKASMQTALDSAALMISKEAFTDTTSQLQANAQKYFTAMFTNPEVKNVNVSVTYTNTGGSTLAATATATLPATFVSVLGFDQFDLAASSTAKWGMTRLRVALVLDNTGSMSQSGKITALKTATNNLLTQIQNVVVADGDAYVSIVPFVNAVNLGSANSAASWIDWTDWNAVNGKCSSTKYTTQSACVAAHKTWTPANHNTWNGCVTDRGLPITTGPDLPSAGNYDENVNLPVAGNLATQYPAYQAPSCPQAAMGLNYDWSAMTTEVNNMQAGGSTDQPIGLVWGLADPCGRRAFHRPGLGPELPISTSHHSFERRFEYPRSLVWQRIDNQHTRRFPNVRFAWLRYLRQHQGSGHHDLYRSGQHRRFTDLHPTAGLRNRLGQVFSADVGGRDRHNVQRDRYQPHQAAPRQIASDCGKKRLLHMSDRNPKRPPQLKDAQDDLDMAVRAAYGMAADADPVQGLFDLNKELAALEAAGQTIVGPGLPASVVDKTPFMSDDKIHL
jgi:Flp pilus assembly protein TadG